jgi:hypothetical protein
LAHQFRTENGQELRICHCAFPRESQLIPASASSGEGGIRTIPGNPAKTELSEMDGAESGALAAKSTLIDPGLALIVEAWPKLPEAVRKAMLALADMGK